MTEEEDQHDSDRLAYYIEIGAVSLEGVDESGEIIYSITDLAKEIAPELWQSHIDYVDKSLIELYEQGMVEIEYNEKYYKQINFSTKSSIGNICLKCTYIFCSCTSIASNCCSSSNNINCIHCISTLI